MKKSVLILVMMFLAGVLFGQNDSSFKDNGKLLERTETDEVITELRNFELRNFTGGSNLARASIVYDDYTNRNIIGKLKWYEELINVHKIYVVKNKHQVNIRKYGRGNKIGDGELWFEISTKSIKGWICYYNDFFRDFFANDNYTYLETIQSSGKNWTINKLEQRIAFLTNSITVMDKPGSDGKIIGSISGMKGESTDMYAITEETEKVDGDTDHWVKIRYDKDAYGWIHGSKIYVERGGPKYHKPEDDIKFLLGDEA